MNQILFLLLCFPVILQAQDEVEWQLKKHVDGIAVYYRETSDSPIKELKITYEIEAPLSTIIAALKDIPAFPKWIFNCSEATLLDSPDEHATMYYSIINFPWPLSDRDAVSYSTFHQDPETKIIYTHNTARADHVARVKGMVRIEKMDIRWKITPLAPGRSHITYIMQSDPGGHIPSWLINFAIDRGPVQSMKAFRDRCQEAQYQDRSISGIVNFE